MNWRYWDWGYILFMTAFFGTIGLIGAAMGYGIYAESQRPEFCLKKDDWKCTQTVTRTTLTLQTSTNANGTITTTPVPVTETHCVKYEPSAN